MNLLAHSDRVFSIDSFVSRSECEALITEAETHGFERAAVRTAAGQQMMQNIRNNDKAVYESPHWVSLLWARLSTIELPELSHQRACGLPRSLRFYRYAPGQRFKMHKDGPWLESGLFSKLTFMVYLNDDFAGGETDFRDFKITPKTGSALLFVHDTWHEGAAVSDGVKYVLRSDVLYKDPLETTASA